MITDAETNFVYLADKLPEKYPRFYQELITILDDNGILNGLLPSTKDIWAVDFMPIQISQEKFIQFTYNPDYLTPKIYQNTKSNVDEICRTLGIETEKSDIILDGGNVIRAKNKVLMCDKVFHENPGFNEKELIKELKDKFEVDKLYFVPWDKKKDYTGHADGMVRFLNNETVLINKYQNESPLYERSLRMSLHNADLDWIEIPYNPSKNKNNDEANGIYVNYLQMEGLIIFPTFDLEEEDAKAKEFFRECFPGQKIESINCNEVAKEGGVLNCITWNIQK